MQSQLFKILTLGASLSAFACNGLVDLAEKKDEKNQDDGVETAAEVEEALGTKGFALTPGEFSPEEKPGRVFSRFLITVLGSEDEPVVGAHMMVQRLGDKAEKFKVKDRVKKHNPNSNIFTLLIAAGREYEVSTYADGYLKSSKVIVFDTAKPVRVAFPVTLERGDEEKPPFEGEDDDGEVDGDEKPVEPTLPRGLKFCDVLGGESDYDQLLELIQKHIPEQYAIIKEKYLQDGKIVGCYGVDYPRVILVFANPISKNKYEIPDASALKDYYYDYEEKPEPQPEPKPVPAELGCKLPVVEGAESRFVMGYEGNSDHSFGYHPAGSVSVEVANGTGSVVLVLSSYEPIRWSVKLKDGLKPAHVILNGYYAQEVKVEGFDNVPVTLCSYYRAIDPTGKYTSPEFEGGAGYIPMKSDWVYEKGPALDEFVAHVAATTKTKAGPIHSQYTLPAAVPLAQ